MVNFKDKIYEQLSTLDSVSCAVSDDYPESFFSGDSEIMCIQYIEEDNRAYEMSGNKCISSYLSYRIEIWGHSSLSDMACTVDALIAGELGLRRKMCRDENEPGLKHKIMRYEGIRDDETGRMYTPG